MIEFIMRMILGHCHKWVMVSTINVTNDGGKIGEIRVLQCEVCGNMRNHKVKW